MIEAVDELVAAELTPAVSALACGPTALVFAGVIVERRERASVVGPLTTRGRLV